jgi:hypothetical protein
MIRSSSAESLSAHPLFRVGLFTGTYLLAACWAALRAGNAEFVFYIVVMILLIASVVGIHGRVRLSPGLLWALSIWGALHMAGGLVQVPDHWQTEGDFRVLYSWWIFPKQTAVAGEAAGWLKYDQVVHAYGFGVATWLCWQGLCGALRGKAGSDGPEEALRPTPGLMVIVAAAGMGLGAANEVVEFVATRITVTNVGGYVNTGWDLIYNALGASLAALVIYVSAGARRP